MSGHFFKMWNTLGFSEPKSHDRTRDQKIGVDHLATLCYMEAVDHQSWAVDPKESGAVNLLKTQKKLGLRRGSTWPVLANLPA